MRHVIIRSLLAAAIGCGCVFDSDAAVYVECDEGAQCWTFVEGWADWAYTLTAERVGALEGTGALAPIGGASECWQVASIALPICAVDVDGARVFGHPDEIGQDHGIILRALGLRPTGSVGLHRDRSRDVFRDHRWDRDPVGPRSPPA